MVRSGSGLGIGLTLFSFFIFGFHDATVKWLAGHMSIWPILFLRAAIIVGVCLAVGGRPLATRVVRTPIKLALLGRGVIVMAAWYFYAAASRDLQLAELSTLYFSAPILVTFLAIPVLGEKVGVLQWIAIGLGFAGVVCAADPTSISVSYATGLVLLAALLWAVAILMIRKVALSEETMVQMIYSNGVFVVLGGIMTVVTSDTPAWSDLGIIVILGFVASLAQFTFFEAMRHAPASVLAPLEYSSMIWAFMIGYVAWGDIPGLNVFAGAGLILVSGMLVIFGERRRMASAAEGRAA
jgi:drug/metabolite transporter (DMT)-like permease